MAQIIRKKPSIDARIERQICTGLIISSEFLEGIKSIYRPGILRSDFANTIATWVIDYYECYKKPIAGEIEDVFRTHKKGDLDPAQAELIEEFLGSISQEYETGDKWNAQYYLEKAENYFRLCALEDHRHELSQCISGGRIEDGEAAIANFSRVARAEIKGVDPFDSQTVVRALSESAGSRLFRLHGVLGNAIGDLKRGYLFGILGNSGIGKSWWLMYVALRALFSGYKVLFVSLEMSESETTCRIQHWITGLPTERHLKKNNGLVLVPVWD